jgi:phage FluMu protein Com
MSVARVQTSKFAARKGATLRCGKCGKQIAKGEGYLWFKVGFRSRYKQVRCQTVGCYPTASERESSKMAGVYAAQESAAASIAEAALGDDPASFVDDLRSTLESAADDWRSVAEEYRDAAEAMGSYGAGANMDETANSIEYAADELGNWSPDEDEPTPCDEHDEYTPGCEGCEELAVGWADDVRDSASTHLDDAQSNIETSF